MKKLFLITFCLLANFAFAEPIVPGWPTDHIAMGTATDGGQFDALKSRPTEVIFSYAGINGAGDRGTFLSIDTKIQRIMKQARDLEKITGKIIHPVIVFYSVDGSDGVWAMQQDFDIDSQTSTNNFPYHYANLIRLCMLLESYRDEKHPIPATLVLNPDFLGELHKQCGQWYCPIALDTKLNIKNGLIGGINLATNMAIDKLNIPSQFLSNSTTIADYAQSINWVIKEFAPHVPFGWQDNVWAGDESGHKWIHNAANNPALVNEHIENETNFLKQFHVFDAPFRPDFIAFDKWERDEFDQTLKGAGLNNGYLYNTTDWNNYMTFVNGISENLQNLPVMLWQIPGGHLQVNKDSDTREDHAATAADYFLGDKNLDLNFDNVKKYIATSTLDPKSYDVTSANVTDYLACPKSDVDCWHRNRLHDPLMKHVFAILWGGGSTTGIIGINPTLDDGGWLSSHF